MSRSEILSKIQAKYQTSRVKRVEPEFLVFEEEMAQAADLELIASALDKKLSLPNPHNSVLLYITGLSNEFDFRLARSHTTGGSPPDIDIDFEADGRDKAVDLVAEAWGRDNVANIITHGTLKPKSLTRRYFKLSTPLDTSKVIAHEALKDQVLGMIPEALFGKDASLEETIEGNPEKGYQPHKELASEPKYGEWYKFAEKLEDMVANFGIHAAGVVISDNPIYEVVPMWSNSKADRITQYDMKEVEELGMIKFDFLAINNLDILKECVALIHKRTGKKYDIYSVPDGDPKAYELLHQGLVSGIFQMETSKSAQDLIVRGAPVSIEELSDISSLNRPGPISAGLTDAYINNKKNGHAPSDLPPTIAELLKETYWTLVYQEQVMKICTEIAGYTLREADDIRRAMGKKKKEVLEPYRKSFIEGCMKNGITEAYATDFWDNTLVGFADYAFNKSHSVAYSFITYLCAYFKANYPTEFFCALMTIRSKVLQPQLWAEKAPEYIQEAKTLGVNIHAPSVQVSGIGFTIVDDEIYFGLNAIRSVGAAASRAIMKARAQTRFKDLWDFLGRVDQRVINSKVLESLIIAGAFDSMGYTRAELRENLNAIVQYLPTLQGNSEHEAARKERDIENERVEGLRKELDDLVKAAKAKAKEAQKAGLPIPSEVTPYLNLKETFEIIANGMDVSRDLTELYEKYGKLRKLPALKPKEVLAQPELSRNRQITISVEELMEQANFIGCYLGRHPARIIFPQATSLSTIEQGNYARTSGQVTSFRQVTTKKGQEMAFIEFGDGTALAEGIIFPQVFKRFKDRGTLPQVSDIVLLSGRVEETEPMVKLIVNDITLNRRKDGHTQMESAGGASLSAPTSH